MEHGEGSEPEDGEILDENEGELAKSEEEVDVGAYGNYRPKRDKRPPRNSRPGKGYARSRMERFVKNTDAYKHPLRRRVNPQKSQRHSRKPYHRSQSRGSPHEFPFYGSQRSNDRSRGSVSPANRLGGSSSQDLIRANRNPIRPNGVNQVLPGSSKGLQAADTIRAEPCSSGTSRLMQNGPAVRTLAPNLTGNPDVEPVSDDEESVTVIPNAETATGKKSPLIITLSSTDTSDDEGESTHREVHRQNIITDDNKVISIVAPVEHPGTSKVEQNHLENERKEGPVDEVVESQAAVANASTSNVDFDAAYSPLDDEDLSGMEVEIVEVVEGEDSNSKGDRNGDNSEGEDDIYELELRNQLLADLVEKTVKQESAKTNAETNAQNLEGNQHQENETNARGNNAAISKVDGDVPDEEESALREVLLSQMAIKRKQLKRDKIPQSSDGMSTVSDDSIGISQKSPGIATTQEQQGGSLNISTPTTVRPPIVGPSQQSHTATPNCRKGVSNGRRGRNNRNRNRHKSDGNKFPLKPSQISPNLLFDARSVIIANEPPRHPAPQVINRPANLKNLPDNDLRNKLLRNRRNEQQQQAPDTSIISLFPEFGIADTDMRRVDSTPRVHEQISDMTIRRTVNFDPSPSASPTTNSSTAITYMAPINVEIPPNDAPSPMLSPCLVRIQNETGHSQLQHHSPFIQSTPTIGSVPISLSPFIVSSPVSCEHHQALIGSPVNYIPAQQSPQGHGHIVHHGCQIRPEVNCSPFGYPVPSVVSNPVYPSPQQVQLIPTSTIHGNAPGLIMSVPGFHNQISFDVDHRFRPQVGVPMYFVGNSINGNRPQMVMSTHDVTRSHPFTMESNASVIDTNVESMTKNTSFPDGNVTDSSINPTEKNLTSSDGQNTDSNKKPEDKNTDCSDPHITDSNKNPVAKNTTSSDAHVTGFIEEPEAASCAAPRKGTIVKKIVTTDASIIASSKESATNNTTGSQDGVIASRKEPIVETRRSTDASTTAKINGPTIKNKENLDVNIVRMKDPLAKSANSRDPRLAIAKKDATVENTISSQDSLKISGKQSIAVTTPSTDESIIVPMNEQASKNKRNSGANTIVPRKDHVVEITSSPDASTALVRKDTTVENTISSDDSVKASGEELVAVATHGTDPNATVPMNEPATKLKKNPDVNFVVRTIDPIVKNTSTPGPSTAVAKKDTTVENTTCSDGNVKASGRESVPSTDANTKQYQVPVNQLTTKTISGVNAKVPLKDPVVKSTSSPDPSTAVTSEDTAVANTTNIVTCETFARNGSTLEKTRSPDACKGSPSSGATNQKPNAGTMPEMSSGSNLPAGILSSPNSLKSSANSSGKASLNVTTESRKTISDPQKLPGRNQTTNNLIIIPEGNPSPNRKGTPNKKPISSSKVVPAIGMTTKSVAFAANIAKPKVKTVTPVVIPVTEGDTTEDEDEEKGETQDGSKKRRKYSFTKNVTSSDPSNPMFHTYLDNFLKNCREKVDKLEKEKSQEVKKGQETPTKGIIAKDGSEKQGEKRVGTPNTPLLEKMENAILGVGMCKTINVSDGTKGSPPFHKGPATRPKNSPNKASSNMQVALIKEGEVEGKTLENESSAVQVLPRKRQGSPTIILPQNKRRAVSGDPSGTMALQLPGTVAPVTTVSPVFHATKAGIAASSSIPTNVQDASANSKAVIESLTERVAETRNQIHLSLKEKELIQIRQYCYNEYKDILRDLQHHTRISNLNSRLDQDIVELEKKLTALKKKKEAAQQKASDINKSIREKSKKALTHKKACLTLATDVKKLGDKIIVDKKYKVPDILVENINELMRSMKNMDSKQTESLQRERGVPFKQLILDEGTFSSSVASSALVPSSNAETASQLQTQKSIQQKKKALPSSSTERPINKSKSVPENLEIVMEKEGKTKQLDCEMPEASQNKDDPPKETQIRKDVTKVPLNREEMSVPSTNKTNSNDEIAPQLISSSKSLSSEDITKGKVGAVNVFGERLPLREGDILSAPRQVGWKIPEYRFSPLQFFRKKGPEK